ncbi:hypothetical protein SAMN04488245_10523 [Alloyangia pacifica]|uniref:Uncharacterized protein n=1 Tax=Alloyangia pacifica TaxID=311180 RepID=A0A1I6SS80_9RHOB|nr:hypothetical protein SAMN04488245_10523 [Alloyangia pacifica]SFS79814.1 hypothetical protein SAMN04488050_10523 [Alloyangia pacifica]
MSRLPLAPGAAPPLPLAHAPSAPHPATLPPRQSQIAKGDPRCA